MRTVLTIAAAGSALLLTAGCAATVRDAAKDGGNPPASSTVPISSTVPASSAVATSSVPVPHSTVPVSSSVPSSTVPTSTVPSSTVPAPRTRQVVIRPVTAAGHVAAGFTLAPPRADDGVDCGGTAPGVSPSPVAVDDGIAGCSPSAAYAVACWNGSVPNTALCFRDPWLRVVAELPDQGRLPVEKAPAVPSPLGLTLSDGSHCMIRDGGAWDSLDGHPDAFGTYSCADGLVVWGIRRSDGIDRSHSLWTVQVASGSGHGALRTMSVRTAYLVGTAAS
jgi:hypothetical protein